jgi:hypothetical protein
MAATEARRQCGSCQHVRPTAGGLRCVKGPPGLDPVSGRARWPRVEVTDYCGAFRDASEPPLAAPDLPTYRDRHGPYCRIPLTQGRFAKVDPEDYPWLAQFRWHGKTNATAVYAVRTVTEDGRTRRIYMHRQIMNTPDHLVCDHVNHDGLDNRSANLRNCTPAQNNANRRPRRATSSRYIGVAWDRARRKWAAHVKKDGRQRNLGLFEDEIAAARARDAAAKKLHGAFAKLNFPPTGDKVTSDR